MGKATLLSVIYVPDGISAKAWIEQCVRHCSAQGYQLVAIASNWADVIRMLMAGHADVAVTGRRDMVPRNLTPRLEVVAEKESHPTPPSQRRPRRLVARELPPEQTR
jgi:hypothetical protein